MEEVDEAATTAEAEVGVAASSSTLDECAVCLSEFEEGDELRELPCGHVFHLECCDRWLLNSGRGQAEAEQTLAERASNCTLLQQRPLPSCPLCKTIALVPLDAAPTTQSPIDELEEVSDDVKRIVKRAAA